MARSERDVEPCGEGDLGERTSASRSGQVRYGASDEARGAPGHLCCSWGDSQAQRKAAEASPPAHGEGRHPQGEGQPIGGASER